jgi:tellurite resistance protein TerC
METPTPIEFWIAFNAGVLFLLALDLFVFHRKAHAVTMKEATIWSSVWVLLSLSFNVLIYYWKGPKPALEFFTGYLIEYSLSVDNIFVFVLIFSYFNVPAQYQHRVLFWGILGALVMRGLMIFLGATLVARFHWVLYIFGAFLLITGARMLFGKQMEVDPEHNIFLKFFRRLVPITPQYHGANFAVREHGKLMFTPLALVLVMVESTDLLFAVDSIPAIFGVTRDFFIVYTSNICAILGLRSLYFLLAGIVPKFIYLQTGLALVLSFIGIKMLIEDLYHVPIQISLIVVTVILAGSIGASLAAARRKMVAEASAIPHGAGESVPKTTPTRMEKH